MCLCLAVFYCLFLWVGLQVCFYWSYLLVLFSFPNWYVFFDAKTYIKRNTIKDVLSSMLIFFLDVAHFIVFWLTIDLVRPVLFTILNKKILMAQKANTSDKET